MHTPAPRALALHAASATYPGTTERIRAVRADLRTLLCDCPMADNMILCASELATNAALHSNSRLPDGTFTVRASINPGDHARSKSRTTAAPGLQGQPTRQGTMGSISSVPLPPTGASRVTTPLARSGQDSTGPIPHSWEDLPVPLVRCL